MNTQVYSLIESLNTDLIPQERLELLDSIQSSLRHYYKQTKSLKLVFVCTHNSRRSIFSEVWASVIASYYKLPEISTYSGGAEETFVSPTTVIALQDQGFDIEKTDVGYQLNLGKKNKKHLFSKRIENEINPSADFVAITTCDNAKESCPLIIGAYSRFHLPYQDPKQFDGQINEVEAYQDTSKGIATELKYLLSGLKLV